MSDHPTRSRAGAALSLHLANGWQAVYWIVGIFAVIVVVHLGVALVAVEATESQGAIQGFLTVFGFIGMVLAVTQMLPFALSLGLTRRTFYLTSAATYLAAGAALTLLVAAIAGVESATNGWGLGLILFDGWHALPMAAPLRWVTFFTVMAAGIFLGALSGAIHARWAVKGMWAALVVLILVVGGAAMLLTWQGGWSAVGRIYDALGPEVVMIGGSLTVAALAGIGAHLVIRRTPF